MATFFTRSGVATKLRRKGGDSDQTKLFENLPEPQRTELLSRIVLSDKEELVIRYVGGDGQWLLVTTQHLFWPGEDEVQACPLRELSDVDGRPADQMLWLRLRKDQLRELEITRADGTKFTILSEPESAFFTLWNTLGAFCKWAAAERRESGAAKL